MITLRQHAISLAAVFLVGALAMRGPLEDNLFGGEHALYWVLVIAVPSILTAIGLQGSKPCSRRRAGR